VSRERVIQTYMNIFKNYTNYINVKIFFVGNTFYQVKLFVPTRLKADTNYRYIHSKFHRYSVQNEFIIKSLYIYVDNVV